MEVEELHKLCGEGDYVLLLLPPPNSGGSTRRLCGNRGPRGEVLCGTPERGQTVRFLSKDVLRHLTKVESTR